MTDAKVKLDPYFRYKQNNEEKTIFMSFALLDQLMKAVGGIERVALIGTDFGVTDTIMSYLFTIDETGKPHPDKYDSYVHTNGLSLETVQDVQLWVGEHLNDFFITSAERQVALNLSHSKRMTAINESVAQATSSIGQAS